MDEEREVQVQSNLQEKAKPMKRMELAGRKKLTSKPTTDEIGLDNPDLGPFLLKVARGLIASGDNPYKALECASRAAKSLEKCSDGNPGLDFVMSLHLLAAIHCSVGQYEEAIPVLESSLCVPVLDEAEHDPEHALAAFAGHMQLGDTYCMLGRIGSSLECYHKGLEIQKHMLGEMDARVGETCRYLAEAHVQAMQFEEAEKLCIHALEIHKMHSPPASLEEAADKRLLALIYQGKGDYEGALENLVLVSMALISHGQEVEMAFVDCSIGDTYVALGRYDEAVFAYHKALTVFKSAKGENHPSVAGAYVRLADLYYKTGKLREASSFCESALRIYEKPSIGSSLHEVASGLAEIAVIYEALNHPEQALDLLHKALKTLKDTPGQQSVIAGIEAQMGVIYYVLGKHADSRTSLNDAITHLRAIGEKQSAFFGLVLNQTGLACVQCYCINEAVTLFEEAKLILEEVCGPHHPDTLAVCGNLAGSYDAMGRLEDAIGELEHVVGIRQEKDGTANPDADLEKQRLTQLLKEAGTARNLKSKSLQALIVSTSKNKKK